MNIQDRQKTLTAEGLRQRYNLDGLDNDRKSIQLIKNSINKVEIEFQNYMDIVNKSLGEYQDQVEITTWFSNDYPTFESPEDHLGDLYYDRENGKAYRFNKTRNLFDKDNANVLTGYINTSKQIISYSGDKIIYIAVKPNTTYTVQKMLQETAANNRFRIATYETEPTYNSTGIDFINYGNGTTVVSDTITTSSNVNYLAFFCYDNDSETTFEEMLNSIQIEEGSTATEYTPYYAWEEIKIDKQVETLAIENSKADTSDDKRIVFVETPITPYTIGDVLIKNGTYYRCRAARESGNYSMNDWIIYTDYTEDMVMLDTRAVVDQLKTNVETNYVSQVQLETNTQGIYASVSSTYTTKTEAATIDGKATTAKTIAETTQSNLSIEAGKIVLINQQIGDRTGKTSTITAEINEIKAEISDIADITKSAERYEAYIPDTEFQDIASSTPINVEIHPVGENISYLYPHDGLFPSDITYLKNRVLRFTNTSTNEIFDYELPDDLLYYDSNVYDIFTADYENKTLQVLKKCKYNADGTVSKLTPVETHTYNFDDFEDALELTQGDYEVSVLGYTVGYIKVRLMALNAYTAQYATKIELRTSIVQTRDYVDIEASKKVGNNEVIGKINLTPETATISANKINIQGVLTAINNDTTTTIDGDKITTGTITANQLSSDSVNASKIVAGTITADKIANATITGSKLVNGTITGAKIEDSTISNSKIANGTIENAKIKNGTIEGTKIKDATITSAKISSIDASKITTGTLTSREINNGNGTFRVTTNGVLTARSGTIGGWSIGTNKLESGSGDNYVMFNSASGTNTAILCGGETYNTAKFSVTKAGTLKATNATIIGNITATSGSFTGEVHATSGSFTGTINATSGSFTGRISSTSGSIAGWTINPSYLSYGGDGGNNGARLYRDGRIYMKSDSGWLNCGSGGAILNGNHVVISDQIGTSGQVDSNTSISLRAFYGHLHLNSNVAVYANNTLLASGSSKNMKTNIKVMTEKDKKEIFKEVKELPLYTYDYKKKYSGQKNNYGIIIEDFEDKLLGKVLHVVSSNEDKNIKNFSHDDLNKVNLIVIKQLIDKIESLENKVNKLEGKINE